MFRTSLPDSRYILSCQLLGLEPTLFCSLCLNNYEGALGSNLGIRRHCLGLVILHSETKTKPRLKLDVWLLDLLHEQSLCFRTTTLGSLYDHTKELPTWKKIQPLQYQGKQHVLGLQPTFLEPIHSVFTGQFSNQAF